MLKEDLTCTAAELIFGTTLRLPGEYFVSHDDKKLNSTKKKSRNNFTSGTKY